jgi:hypothetical protein
LTHAHINKNVFEQVERVLQVVFQLTIYEFVHHLTATGGKGSDLFQQKKLMRWLPQVKIEK